MGLKPKPFGTAKKKKSSRRPPVLGHRLGSRDDDSQKMKKRTVVGAWRRENEFKDRRIDGDDAGLLRFQAERHKQLKRGTRRAKTRDDEEEEVLTTTPPPMMPAEAESTREDVEALDSNFSEVMKMLELQSRRKQRPLDDYDKFFHELSFERRVQASEPSSSRVESVLTGPLFEKITGSSSPQTATLSEFAEVVVSKLSKNPTEELAVALRKCAFHHPPKGLATVSRLVKNIVLDAIDDQPSFGDLQCMRVLARLPRSDFVWPVLRRAKIVCAKALTRRASDLVGIMILELDVALGEWTPELRALCPDLPSQQPEERKYVFASTEAEVPVPKLEKREYSPRKKLERELKSMRRRTLREARSATEVANATALAREVESVQSRRARRQKNLAWLEQRHAVGWQ